MLNIKYSVSQKSVPSLTSYKFTTHPPIFTIFGTSSAEIQKSAAGITFRITRFYLLYNALK